VGSLCFCFSLGIGGGARERVRERDTTKEASTLHITPPAVVRRVSVIYVLSCVPFRFRQHFLQRSFHD